MKKVTAMLLLLALFMSLALPASATGVEPRAVCQHEYVKAHSTAPFWAYYDKTYHRLKIIHTYVCNLCGNSYQMSTYPTTGTYIKVHTKYYESATCNGTTQSYRIYCEDCDHTWTDTATCPGGPHTGNCRWLPG